MVSDEAHMFLEAYLSSCSEANASVVWRSEVANARSSSSKDISATNVATSAWWRLKRAWPALRVSKYSSASFNLSENMSATPFKTCAHWQRNVPLERELQNTTMVEKFLSLSMRCLGAKFPLCAAFACEGANSFTLIAQMYQHMDIVLFISWSQLAPLFSKSSIQGRNPNGKGNTTPQYWSLCHQNWRKPRILTEKMWMAKVKLNRIITYLLLFNLKLRLHWNCFRGRRLGGGWAWHLPNQIHLANALQKESPLSQPLYCSGSCIVFNEVQNKLVCVSGYSTRAREISTYEHPKEAEFWQVLGSNKSVVVEKKGWCKESRKLEGREEGMACQLTFGFLTVVALLPLVDDSSIEIVYIIDLNILTCHILVVPARLIATLIILMFEKAIAFTPCLVFPMWANGTWSELGTE